MARREELYLRDIVQSVEVLRQFVRDRSEADLRADVMFQDAVIRRLSIIGEAVAHISSETRDRYPEMRWSDVVGFRNVAIHSYFSLDLSLIWTTAVSEAPELGQFVAEILEAEYGDSHKTSENGPT